MFARANLAGGKLGRDVDQLERRVRADEAEISRLRARQVADLRELDRYPPTRNDHPQVPPTDEDSSGP